MGYNKALNAKSDKWWDSLPEHAREVFIHYTPLTNNPSSKEVKRLYKAIKKLDKKQ